MRSALSMASSAMEATASCTPSCLRASAIISFSIVTTCKYRKSLTFMIALLLPILPSLFSKAQVMSAIGFMLPHGITKYLQPSVSGIAWKNH
ncbi:hypothetical protein WR25_21445 [Diploscapter pachys]|uniref:Uncharacterized protein n=1 Tax=Diploscapter pachys TaxID=2018661 RepID=A0A2A2JEN6_9BILA|nr:hypothetical protein WR25_21445 [Diploscapter pachys]